MRRLFSFTPAAAGNSADSRLLWAASWVAILSLPLMIVGIAGTEISVALIGVLFIMHSALTRDWQWTRTPWVKILLLLWLYTVIRSLFTPEWESALTRSLVWIRYPLIAAALAFWVVRDEAIQKKLLWSLLLTAAFLVFDTFIQYATGTDVFGRELIRSGDQVRLTGPFSNPRVGITIAWIMFPALAVLLAQQAHSYFCSRENPTCLMRRSVWSLVAVLAVVASLTAIYVAGERMALLFSLMGLVLCFITIKRARLSLLIAALVGALVISAVSAQNPALKARQVGESSKEITGFWNSPYGRLWKSSAYVLEDNMLFGIGPKHYRTLCHHPRYSIVEDLSNTAPCLMHPHNIYLEWLAETGLIGFALFIALITHWLLLLWQSRRAIFTDPLLAGLMIALAIRLWPLSSTTSQFSGWSAGPFWLLTGWLLARLVWHETQQRARKE